ncbi:helix-turn-helix transcriptional regulator [Kurthia huakuii]|uniref:helix-turn-helix transcriptional regulator n=1 Tax=Kurthia huakuii TaxID=1421019 RepID=UPI00049726FE|nr:helix-turn-helix transcriptional regulator [Kurthia huakuii]MBM7700480.1 DNA-binding PadR family transcriptional regulator [Kurthia huakuii]
MEDRLKKLKKSLEHTAFSHATFTAKHRSQVRAQMEKASLEQLMLSLLLEEKSGVMLTELLHAKGWTQLHENEGDVYTILHEAEQQGFITARWEEDVKYYQLTKLGKKQLQEDATKKLRWEARLHVE